MDSLLPHEKFKDLLSISVLKIEELFAEKDEMKLHSSLEKVDTFSNSARARVQNPPTNSSLAGEPTVLHSDAFPIPTTSGLY